MAGNSDSDWRKMMRVVSGSVGRDILKETRDQKKEEYPVDRTLLSIRNWESEFEFRNILNYSGLSEEGKKYLVLAYSRFRQQQMTSFLQVNQDSLSTWAILDQSELENSSGGFHDIMHFIWHFKYDLGPTKQGKLIELIGPMRSGKNNFAVYLARGAMSAKIHVITSFPLFFPQTSSANLKVLYWEAHGLREALLHVLEVRMKEPEAIFFLILDEQTTRGASNMRSNALEAEWANGWIVRSGHFGVTTVRLMQGDSTITIQKKLRYAEIYKNTRVLNKAEGKILGEGEDWPITFHSIPDMTKYYNTASPGSWVWDLDPQAMNDYMAIHETEAEGSTIKFYEFYHRYIRTLMQTDDPYWFRNKDFKHLDKSPEELKQGEEQKRIEEEEKQKLIPLPLHHLECPKLSNGLMWTWTPKRYHSEGERVMCPKCHKMFRVHYTQDPVSGSDSQESNSGSISSAELEKIDVSLKEEKSPIS